MHPFRSAIEAGYMDRARELCSPEVVFYYEREIGAEGASDHALLFRARVGDLALHGRDFLHTVPTG